MALTRAVTLAYVARTKAVSKQVQEAFGRVLTRWVNDTCDGNQTHAAKLLKVSQSHISAMMKGDRGPGLNTLILMREKTGLSIDEMLGLGLPPAEDLTERLRASFDLEVARFRADAQRTLEEAQRKLAEAAQLAEPHARKTSRKRA